LTPTHVLGIDPGKTGALALYCPQDGSLQVEDVPTLATRGAGKAKSIDHYGIARIVDVWALFNPIVFIELVGSRPGEGHAGAFDFGLTTGILRGCVAAHFLRIELVTPAVWKRALACPAAKDGARARASTLFPSHSAKWARVKDDGRAEASLIALYGAQKAATL
jgi:crossover junction endodeoxyribonuclease RuvC